MHRREFCTVVPAGITGSTIGWGRVAADGDPPVVSTRGHFGIDWGGAYRVDGVGPLEYDTNGQVPGIDGGCASDVTVFVHGFKTKSGDVKGRLSDIRDGLAAGGYDGTVTGYSWDGDNELWHWWETTDIARWNGKKLAAFTADWFQLCPGVNVRYVGYSLGAQLVLSALDELAAWGVEDRVDAVALLGAAVPNDQAALDGRYGPAIESHAQRLDNYWYEGDTVLNWAFTGAEWAQALGSNGLDGPAPGAYSDHHVSVGDHFSYHDPDDGCLDAVAAHW